jgi:two-component system sensor histidine kinase PilS (NtrC family)
MKKNMPRNFVNQILFDSTPREGNTDYWRALLYLNIYRMLLAVFLVTASLATINVGSLGSRNPDLFSSASFSYVCLSILFSFSIHKGWPHYITQCRLQILADITIIIILYYASGGRGAGLEILLFVSVSASGILLGGRGALTAAAVATILLILEHFYVIATNQRTLGGFTTLGLIGGGLFVTAFIIYYLSLLLRKTEEEIAQQNLDLQKLSHLNELIVEQLNSGVLVVNQNLDLILINQSGRIFLGISDTFKHPLKLNDFLPALFLKINSGRQEEASELKIELPSGRVFLAHYKPLDKTLNSGYIILLDDFSKIEKEQRNEKFMAMGRLSASIAHEIRNPLGAISHAGQLLAESSSITKNDCRLVEIIENQSRRIDQIIQTILELGHTNNQHIQKVRLYEWLTKIVNGFINEKGLDKNSIQIKGNKSITACGDPEQLQHVILNLLSNSLNFADTSADAFAFISIAEDKATATKSISITDNGPGIAKSIKENVFEPFFTTSSTGNGLGLYIARKICLSNHGYLDYLYDQSENGYFKITLANSDACQKPHISDELN